MRCQIVRNLSHRGNCGAETSGLRVVYSDVLSAAGGEIRTPTIGRIGGETEKGGENLRIQWSRIGGRRPGTVGHGARPKAIVKRCAAGTAEHLVIAGIDSAVAENDDLAELLSKRLLRKKQQSSSAQQGDKRITDRPT